MGPRSVFLDTLTCISSVPEVARLGTVPLRTLELIPGITKLDSPAQSFTIHQAIQLETMILESELQVHDTAWTDRSL